MILLLTTSLDTVPDSPHVGRLLQPRHVSRAHETAARGIPWAADNDCFQGLDPDAYYTMLDRLTGVPNCLFVSVPDIVADPIGTIRGWVRWSEGVRRRGLPIAFVAQDGCEHGFIPPFHTFDALFIGGSTEYKLGPTMERLVRAAKAHGKWVHMGRVNTGRRMRYAAEIGCDSVDGTKWVRWRSTYEHEALRLLNEINTTPQLRLVA